MEVKHFDYQEFVKIKSKSLNCESCGGGLRINMSNGKTCDCEYCGNTNMILDEGKTKVIENVVDNPAPKGEEKKEVSKKTMIILGVIMGVAAIGAAYYFYKKTKQYKEEKSGRKRLLLLSK